PHANCDSDLQRQESFREGRSRGKEDFPNEEESGQPPTNDGGGNLGLLLMSQNSVRERRIIVDTALHSIEYAQEEVPIEVISFPSRFVRNPVRYRQAVRICRGLRHPAAGEKASEKNRQDDVRAPRASTSRSEQHCR